MLLFLEVLGEVYCFIQNVFPYDFYIQMLDNFPDISIMSTLRETGRTGYDNRFVLLFNQQHFWLEFKQLVLEELLLQTSMSKINFAFTEAIHKQQKLSLKLEILLVSDVDEYAISPHTDTASRLLTMIFIYLTTIH